jgi:hypothetical protein
MDNRRAFLWKVLSAASAAAIAPRDARAQNAPSPAARSILQTNLPWFKRTTRWMQTNIAELDATRYDIPFWRAHWKRTHTQGIVVNAGGIVAYYPTKVPFHRRAEFLGDRDLFGDLVKAAREEGIVVFARMDSNGAGEELFRAHPDWFTKNAAGQPYRRDQTLYAPCINGPYYRQHIPAILKEIATIYKPEGFTDNSWSGLGRGSICYCSNCRDAFGRASNLDLPQRADWMAANYRAWIEWSYATRLEIWDLYNKTARDAAGPECLWVGMMNGALSAAASAFRDYREICRRAEMIMLDNQQRGETGGFQTNGQTGKLVHGMLGWDKLTPESFALYQTGGATFRLASRREPEARMWAIEGAAGGIQPWWHYINAYHEDRRQYETPVALSDWITRNQEYLINRQPLATVGILYSQRNNDFFGRDDVEAQVNQPQRGFAQSLTRARIPYLFVNADDIERDTASLRVLVLPNVGLLTDDQAAAVTAFARRGGGLVATGATSLFDRWGDPRPDFALANLFGMHVPADHAWRDPARRRQLAGENVQTYLRLTPELRAAAYGPHVAGEPAASGQRHPILRGFETTDILPFGGSLPPLVAATDAASAAQPLLTFVPPLPAFPPESVWSRETRTTIPGLVYSDRASRVVYMPADIDRRYARDNNPDHGDLLANAVRWAAGEDGVPLKVDGRGLLDWHVYRQTSRLVLHCVNLTNEGAWRAPIDELIPVGPLRVQVRMPDGLRARRVRCLVAGSTPAPRTQGAWTQFDLTSVLDHEVMVIE